jgi:hypothetical protein
MFYLRSVRNHAVFKSKFDLDKAVQWLQDRNGEQPSVYEVDGIPMANRVITLLAMSGKDRPEQVDYILISADILPVLGLVARATPSDIQHALLDATHRELVGLDSREKVELLATAIRDGPLCDGQRRLPKTHDLGALARAEVEHPEFQNQALALIAGKPKWLALVEAAGLL